MRKLNPAEIPRPAPDALDGLRPHPIVVLVDNVRSIYNVGSIFRTSDAARIEHLYLAGITGTPEHRQLHKTALGAQDTVPWTHVPDAVPLARRLRAQGYTLAALEITDTPTPIYDVAPHHFPICLIVGHEVDGISPALLDEADLALEIPQFGSKHSLNVAVAYGIGVFELVFTCRAVRDPTS